MGGAAWAFAPEWRYPSPPPQPGFQTIEPAFTSSQSRPGDAHRFADASEARAHFFHRRGHTRQFKDSAMDSRRIRYATDPEYRAWKKAVARRWYEANEARAHAGALRRLYGLSLQDYDDLLARQNGGCGICRRKPKKKGKRKRRLCVDHDHRTRKIRGLLCINCNTGLGCYGDSPKFLRMAADYLETWHRVYESTAPRIPKSSPRKSSKKRNRKGKT
jgi:hypothetical protein